jgi:nitrous oxidase accessory protein
VKILLQQYIPPASTLVAGGLLLAALFSLPPLAAAERQVEPGAGTLQAAIDQARDGDTLLLKTGIYSGSVNVNRSVVVQGGGGSVVDGENSGHVITVNAPDTVIRNLVIRHSGDNLMDEDSAVFVTEQADRARIESNRLEDNLIGIYLKGPKAAVVSNNVIIGSRNHRINDRGNGVYLWNTPGSVVTDNDIRYGRDGIYVTTSRNNIFSGNRMRDLRFAVHYMYTHDSEVSNNVSLNNHVGYALMFSDRILVKHNRSLDDHERGLFFNFANYSVIDGNRVSGGPEKCVFIYNANFNRFTHNWFEDCRVGIHFTAGSDNNEIFLNAFINNRTQVKYVGTRYIEWSRDGVGNYWSDNLAFDIDGDGIADQSYKPNDLVDQILWRHPLAKLLLNSPALQILKWAQSEFPGIHPGGVTDTAPLMLPARVDAAATTDSAMTTSDG